jgi:hypothetical protein
LTLAIEFANGFRSQIQLRVESEAQQSHLHMAFHVQIAITVDLPVTRAGVVIVMIFNRFQMTSTCVLLPKTIIKADHNRTCISQHLSQAQILTQHVLPLGLAHIFCLPGALPKEIRCRLGIQIFHILPVQVRQRLALVAHDQRIGDLV